MQITFESTFEHWATAHLIGLEYGEAKKIRRHDSKHLLHLIILLLIFDIYFFFTFGLTAFVAVYTLLIIYLIVSLPSLRPKAMQAKIYYRLKIAYAQAFEEEKDKTVQWELTPEHFVLRNSDIETRLSAAAIKQIVVCPQYLFVQLDLSSYAALPKAAVPEADYISFCEYLINWYQSHLHQLHQAANVIQSNWTFETSASNTQAVSEGPVFKFSLRKVFLTLLWAILFLIAGSIFFGILALATLLFLISTELLPYSEETTGFAAATGFMIGTASSTIAGLVLGLLGKLPGTK
jgi:hypothetical protein